MISGEGGSGTVFFSGCTLQCSFCQNWQISHRNIGAEISPEKLSQIFTDLWKAGAENINLVTGTPHIPSIVSALEAARDSGMRLPIVWNSSGYELLSSLEMLSEHVEVYLADLKTLDRSLSGDLFGAPDYPRIARMALPKMLEGRKLQCRNHVIKRGVIIRHLVLPGKLESTYRCLEWFQREIGAEALFSLMFQYLPSPHHAAGQYAVDQADPDLDDSSGLPNRKVSTKEQETVLRWLDDFGITEGFVQELPGDGSWLPDFAEENPFPADRAQALWHWHAR